MQQWWVLGLPGKHITCFCSCLGAEIKGSVLEVSKEAILGIITGNFLRRMLLLSMGKTQQKQNKAPRKSLIEGVLGRSLSGKKIPGVTPFQEDRKGNSSAQEANHVEANMLQCRWRNPFSRTFQG